MLVKDAEFSTLFNRRVWNFTKTQQGTITKLRYESKNEDRKENK